MPGVRRSLRPVAFLAAVVIVGASLAVNAPAQAAAPSAPLNLAPNGSSGTSSIPTLSWDRVADASFYDVQIAKDPNFNTLVWTQDGTWNDQATPWFQLPKGQLYWRVRADSSGGTSGWSTATFVRAANSPPTLQAPSNGGAPLAQPSQTPAFQWSPVQGAQDYVVRVGQDPSFTDPVRTVFQSTVQANAATLSGLLAPGTYYWEVQAEFSNGLFNTDFSSSFVVHDRRTGAGRPAVTRQRRPTVAVQDVVLDWAPVLGASTYDLQVSTDQNFNTTVIDQAGVAGTRYSPAITLNNDQYFWRVRAVDAAGHRGSWNLVPTWRFKRNYPDQPTLQYPADGATVGDPFFYQWSGVPRASRYVVQVSTDAAFTDRPNNPVSCFTSQTTLTPGSPGPGLHAHTGRHATTGGCTPVDDPRQREDRLHLGDGDTRSRIEPDVPAAAVAGERRHHVGADHGLGSGGGCRSIQRVLDGPRRWAAPAATSPTPRRTRLDPGWPWATPTAGPCRPSPWDGTFGTLPEVPFQPTFTVGRPADPDSDGPEPRRCRAAHHCASRRSPGSRWWAPITTSSPCARQARRPGPPLLNGASSLLPGRPGRR